MLFQLSKGDGADERTRWHPRGVLPKHFRSDDNRNVCPCHLVLALIISLELPERLLGRAAFNGEDELHQLEGPSKTLLVLAGACLDLNRDSESLRAWSWEPLSERGSIGHCVLYAFYMDV